MNQDQIQHIAALADAMAGEIEWCGLDGDSVGQVALMTAVLRRPGSVPAIRVALRSIFYRLADRMAFVAGHQEPELEAAGLVQQRAGRRPFVPAAEGGRAC